MGMFISWASEHWFTLLQTVGIVGALSFNAYSMLLNARNRKVDTLINITQQHRAIWLKFLDSPTLKRVNKANVDLKKHPITEEEFIFVNLIILHLTTVLVAVKKRILTKPAGLDTDIGDLFALPIPHAVWNDAKAFRDPDMICYVEGLLDAK